ncbi:MAG: pilus assembly PilX N-terminal domain-containing protein [Candidatus Shapirobacteria bacterium]|nr:pilus assembly PilX N-terminal domain-containing protein [Candidatus Shapirobacteria bacterium]
MKNKIKNNLRKGQVAIIVMLVSALLVTVGLSLSKKTTVETKIDYNEEALKKAFNAAESGIDYYLATGQKTYDSDDNLSEANVTTENIGDNGSGILDFKEFTPANGVQYFWLVNHNDDGSLGNNYFSGSMITVTHGWTSNYGSLEIGVYYKNALGVYGVKRYGYNFDTSSKVYNFSDLGNVTNVTINPIPSNPILMTVTPIFQGANISISGNGFTFPVQGEKINSVGSAGVVFDGTQEESKINKKLSIERRYKFPYFLLSGIVSETSVLSQ